MSDRAQIRAAREIAAAELTALMREERPFSFLRMGDGELRWMLEVQEGLEQTRYRYARESRLTSERVHGTGGLEPRHYSRLKWSYERCSYLDLQSSFPYNAENLDRLRLERPGTLLTNSQAETSMVSYTWMAREFRSYAAGRKCLFASAEAGLLEQLWADPEYRSRAANLWPEDARPAFQQVRDDGRGYSENLEAIKEDLTRSIAAQGIDTMFLSLGGGAKILCYELAEQLKIAAFDLGAISRGLTYSASPGYQSFRARHHPFFFRIPLETFMKALGRAFPGMSAVTRLAKAQAQLCRELQRREVGTSFADEAYEPANFEESRARSRAFERDLAFYRAEVLPTARRAPEGRRLEKDFVRWCAKRGLGWRGKLFRLGRAVSGSER